LIAFGDGRMRGGGLFAGAGEGAGERGQHGQGDGEAEALQDDGGQVGAAGEVGCLADAERGGGQDRVER
jgi:hypothetical protein